MNACQSLLVAVNRLCQAHVSPNDQLLQLYAANVVHLRSGISLLADLVIVNVVPSEPD
jgi:hypothetical protein